MIHEPNATTGCRWRPTSAYFATSQADRLDEIASVEEKEVTLPQLAMSEAYEIAEEVHERWRYVLGFRGEAEAPPQEEEPAPVIRSAQLSGRPAESAAPAPTGRVAAVTRVGAAPIIPLEDTALAGSERVRIDIGGQMMAEVMTEVRATLTTKSAAVALDIWTTTLQSPTMVPFSASAARSTRSTSQRMARVTSCVLRASSRRRPSTSSPTASRIVAVPYGFRGMQRRTSTAISKTAAPYNDGTGLASPTWHDYVTWPKIFPQKSYIASSPNQDIGLID